MATETQATEAKQKERIENLIYDNEGLRKQISRQQDILEAYDNKMNAAMDELERRGNEMGQWQRRAVSLARLVKIIKATVNGVELNGEDIIAQGDANDFMVMHG